MSSRVYINGDYLATDCPLPDCNQEVRADVHGDRVRFNCRGGHDHGELEGVIDPAVIRELITRARDNTDGDITQPAESNGDKQPKPGSALQLREHEPWATPVDGRTVAGDVAAAIERHVVLPLEGIVAVTLWVLFTWVHDSSRISPLLVLSSPRSGVERQRSLE